MTRGKDYKKTGIYPEKYEPIEDVCTNCANYFLAAWLPAECPHCKKVLTKDSYAG
jgi:hypothetical protein